MNTRFHARQWWTYGSGFANTVQRVRRIHVRLGHAVTFQDAMTGASFEFDESLLQQRCRARDKDANIPANFAGKVITGQQSGVISRHTHHDRAFGQERDHLCGIISGEPTHAGTAQKCTADCDEKSMDMKYGQRVKQSVGFAKTP